MFIGLKCLKEQLMGLTGGPVASAGGATEAAQEAWAGVAKSTQHRAPQVRIGPRKREGGPNSYI